MSLADRINTIRTLAGQGQSQSQIAAATGLEIGDVVTALNLGMPGAELTSGSAGSPVVRKFPFAFDTPNLLTGAALYTPTIGDVLLDAWFEIGTAWNGTTPFGDFGTFVEDNGFFQGLSSVVVMTDAAVDDNWGSGLGVLQPTTPSALAARQGIGMPQVVPAKFIAANPLKVVVTTTGHPGGADPGSTQGAAVLYLVTASPA